MSTLQRTRVPSRLVRGFPSPILNRNKPAFYCVPAKAFEALLNRLEDAELNAIANARGGETVIKIALYDL